MPSHRLRLVWHLHIEALAMYLMGVEWTTSLATVSATDPPQPDWRLWLWLWLLESVSGYGSCRIVKSCRWCWAVSVFVALLSRCLVWRR